MASETFLKQNRLILGGGALVLWTPNRSGWLHQRGDDPRSSASLRWRTLGCCLGLQLSPPPGRWSFWLWLLVSAWSPSVSSRVVELRLPLPFLQLWIASLETLEQVICHRWRLHSPCGLHSLVLVASALFVYQLSWDSIVQRYLNHFGDQIAWHVPQSLCLIAALH